MLEFHRWTMKFQQIAIFAHKQNLSSAFITMLEDFRLKIFLKVAQTGSFTVAAKELGISQPAVSQSINNLEKTLGAQLLTRSRGLACLTAEGFAFREYAERILYWYSAADAMFGAEGRLTDNTRVRICADPVCAAYLLPETLSVICGARPKSGFSIITRDGLEEYVSNIFESGDASAKGRFGENTDADVQVSIFPSPETMDFEGESRLVGVLDAAVVASGLNRSATDAAQARLKPFSTLAGVHVSNRFALWKGYEAFLTPDLEARVAVVSSSIEAVKAMTEASDSLVGIVPEPSVRKELADGRLLRLPVQLPEFTYDIHFDPRPEFAGKTICQLLRDTLVSVIRYRENRI